MDASKIDWNYYSMLRGWNGQDQKKSSQVLQSCADDYEVVQSPTGRTLTCEVDMLQQISSIVLKAGTAILAYFYVHGPLIG